MRRFARQFGLGFYLQPRCMCALQVRRGRGGQNGRGIEVSPTLS